MERLYNAEIVVDDDDHLMIKRQDHFTLQRITQLPCDRAQVYRVRTGGARHMVARLLKRNDLTALYRTMLYSRTTTKQEFALHRLYEYGYYLMQFAVTLFEEDVRTFKFHGLKVNYYSLNPIDLMRTSGYKGPEAVDCQAASLHTDISGTSRKAMTLCMVRGIHGYDKSMGKEMLLCPDTRVICDDDSSDVFHIFDAKTGVHGSTVWNPIVKEQFAKCKLTQVPNEPNSPGRMSMTMPIFLP